MVPIPALRRCGKPNDVAGLYLGKHALERHCWEVVALVDDDLPVVRDETLDLLLPHKALDHGDVKMAVPRLFSRPDLPNARKLDVEEQGQLGAYFAPS